MINETYYKRRYVITSIIIVAVIIFLIELFWLQIIDQSTKDKADSNALLKQTIYPSRGLIYDRNGELLVFNQPIYDVTLICNEMDKNFDTLNFCATLGISRADFEERISENIKKHGKYAKYTSQLFATQLSNEDIAPLQQTLYKYPGVSIRKRTLRDYTYSSAAQVLGSIGEVSQKTIDNDNYYSVGDYAGRDGIELTYEKYLRGEKGVEILLRDSKGRIQGSYNDGEDDIAPVSGGNLQLTLDIQLQILAEYLLHGKIGSVVAIEPRTGEILALASSPTWNPKLLVGKTRSKHYNELMNDPTKPLLNRATQAMYPPGSTFKTAQAVVCMENNTLSVNTFYPCNGKASVPIACTHSHGSPVNLLSAIEQSCNPYFWYAYRDFLEKNDYGSNNENFRKQYQLWRDMIMSMGLGKTFSDSDVPTQKGGSIPSIQFYDKIYKGKNNWKAKTIRSNSIGQGEVLVTPLQLCNMAATIANEGYYITPHLNKADSMLEHRHNTGFQQKHFKIVKEGMERVMEYGTGRYYKLDSIRVGGKTGTAQVQGKQDHALFIGIAPIDEPQIAVAVVVENAGFGATWAAPIGSLIIEQYLTDTIKRTELKERMHNSILNPNVK